MNGSVQLVPLDGFPLVEPGDNLPDLVLTCLQNNNLVLQEGDILVIAQKVVSKAEGRYVRLAEVAPSADALALAERSDKDPRQAELILQESNELVRVRPGVIIVEHKLGYVHANAGIDRSNIPYDESDPQLLLLPLDPDASAERMLEALRQSAPLKLAVIINDSAGRAWRNGSIGFSLGSAGIEALSDQVGDADLFGRKLEVTEVAVADELAAAASFLMGQAAEACPVVLIRGAQWRSSEQGSQTLIRDRELDMFR